MAALTPILVNGWKSTVQAGSSAIGSSTATGINVATGDGAKLPTIGTNQFIPMVVTDASGNITEYVWGTARSTDALTVTRQAEDSTRFAASTTSIQAGYSIYAIATRAALVSPVPLWDPGMQGIGSSTLDPYTPTTSISLTSGQLRLIRVPVPAALSFSKVWIGFATAPATLTSGQNFVGVYSADGTTKLGGSADQATAWAGGVAMYGVALTSTVTVTSDVTNVWVAVLVNASTPGALLASTAGNANVSAFAINATSGSVDRTVARSGTSGSALTALPASFSLGGIGISTQLPLVWLT